MGLSPVCWLCRLENSPGKKWQLHRGSYTTSQKPNLALSHIQIPSEPDQAVSCYTLQSWCLPCHLLLRMNSPNLSCWPAATYSEHM